MLRPKVQRVIKLKATKRAFLKSNPFKLNDKDYRQLKSWLKCYVKLFVNF